MTVFEGSLPCAVLRVSISLSITKALRDLRINIQMKEEVIKDLMSEHSKWAGTEERLPSVT